MHMAIGTSLAIMIFTAFSSAYAYQKRDFILWSLFWRFIPSALVGSLLGALVATHLSGDYFTAFLQCFCC